MRLATALGVVVLCGQVVQEMLHCKHEIAAAGVKSAAALNRQGPTTTQRLWVVSCSQSNRRRSGNASPPSFILLLRPSCVLFCKIMFMS
jgi:hypothetical protein